MCDLRVKPLYDSLVTVMTVTSIPLPGSGEVTGVWQGWGWWQVRWGLGKGGQFGDVLTPCNPHLAQETLKPPKPSHLPTPTSHNVTALSLYFFIHTHTFPTAEYPPPPPPTLSDTNTYMRKHTNAHTVGHNLLKEGQLGEKLTCSIDHN